METLESHEKLQATPFLKWAGGKSQLLREFDRYIPPKFATYYEPFLGGGALFFHLYSRSRVHKAVISDSNPDLINAFVVVRDHLDQLQQKLTDLQKHARDSDYYYKKARKRFNEIKLEKRDVADVEKAALLLYLNKTCFNGLYRVNRNGEFNVPWGNYKNPKIFNERNLKAVSAILNEEGIKVECHDFTEVLDGANRDDFVYFDPPYHPLSSTASFAEYTPNSFGMADQEKLAEIFHKLSSRGCYVMLSNSPMVLSLYAEHGYTIDKVKANRAINSVGTKRGAIEELLVMNYRR